MWEIIQGVVSHFNFTTKHKRIVQGSNKNKNHKNQERIDILIFITNISAYTTLQTPTQNPTYTLF